MGRFLIKILLLITITISELLEKWLCKMDETKEITQLLDNLDDEQLDLINKVNNNTVTLVLTKMGKHDDLF